jgi:hypothetical protein
MMICSMHACVVEECEALTQSCGSEEVQPKVEGQQGGSNQHMFTVLAFPEGPTATSGQAKEGAVRAQARECYSTYTSTARAYHVRNSVNAGE